MERQVRSSLTRSRARKKSCSFSSVLLECLPGGEHTDPYATVDDHDAEELQAAFGCAATLSREVSERISSVLLSESTASPSEALPIVVDELRKLLIPDGESGRVSIWTIDFANIQMVATSAQGEADDALDGLDAAFDAEDNAFLYGLSRDESDHGLFKSKSEIMDQGIPNAPGYDQLMYAACLHRGSIIAVLGVGRRFQEGVEHRPWEDVHLASVRAVADMLECAFMRVEEECVCDTSEGKRLEYQRTESMTEQYIIDEQYHEMSYILGKVADRCSDLGLLSVALWEYDHGDLLLYPGRRTRQSVTDDFEETSIDSCIVIDVKSRYRSKVIYLLARVDAVGLDVGGDSDNLAENSESEMEKWLKDLKRSHRGDSPMTRTIGGFSVGANGRLEPPENTIFKSNKAVVNVPIPDLPFAEKLTGVQGIEGKQTILVPTFFRGELCAVLSFVIDKQAAKDSNPIPAIVQHALYARKKMKSLSWKVQIMQSEKIALPNLENLMTKIIDGNAVALTGAGFSMPANLVGWSDLLRALLAKVEETGEVDHNQFDFIERLISTGTADTFDQAAQCLEDSLGREFMQKEMGKLLAIDSTAMPRVMQRRIKIFRDIPWRAILTTNYDLCFSGPTPQCSDAGDAYVSALRYNKKRIGEQLTQKISAPVIKLHGCVNRGNIVFTRSGYRELLYSRGGYKVFLQSLMASHTFVSIGHSGTDAYLNDLNSELLTMFNQSDLPLRYSIAPVSDGHASFAKRYDGLNFITWDKDVYGWGFVDHILLKLRMATNPRVRMANILRGRRILLVDSSNARPIDCNLLNLASTLFSIHPTAIVHILDDPQKLCQTTQEAVSNVAPYDIILMVYDKDTPKAVESIQTSQLGCRAPVAIIKSDCPGYQRGILSLQGRVLPLVIRDEEDALEELYTFLDNAKAMHGDKNVRRHKQSMRLSVGMQAFL